MKVDHDLYTTLIAVADKIEIIRSLPVSVKISGYGAIDTLPEIIANASVEIGGISITFSLLDLIIYIVENSVEIVPIFNRYKRLSVDNFIHYMIVALEDIYPETVNPAHYRATSTGIVERTSHFYELESDIPIL